MHHPSSSLETPQAAVCGGIITQINASKGTNPADDMSERNLTCEKNDWDVMLEETPVDILGMTTLQQSYQIQLLAKFRIKQEF